MPSKKYKDNNFYERKLEIVMGKLEVDEYNWNYDRHAAYIDFYIKGEYYRFDHSVAKAREAGENINFGSDCFAQLVLALEDLARISNRKIYKLQRWIEGMRSIPASCGGGVLPQCFVLLGFNGVPKDAEEIKGAYRKLAAQTHPDKGGRTEDFARLGQARDEAMAWIEGQS